MALAAQALETQKARKPLEQGRALEQVGARMKRVMGLTFELTRVRKRAKPAVALRVQRMVRPRHTLTAKRIANPSIEVAR